MPSTKRARRPLPSSPDAWFEEIVLAYEDAREAVPFVELLGDRLPNEDLFHLAPVVSLKFRGLAFTPRRLKQATDAALSSYVASTSRSPELESHGSLAFAFCYLASHFGLDLLTETDVDHIMEFLVTRERRLTERLAKQPRSRRKRPDVPSRGRETGRR